MWGWWMAATALLGMTVLQQSHLASYAATEGVVGTGGSVVADDIMSALHLGGRTTSASGGSADDGSGGSTATGKSAVVDAIAQTPVEEGVHDNASPHHPKPPLDGHHPASSSSSTSAPPVATVTVAAAAALTPEALPITNHSSASDEYPTKIEDHAIRRFPELLLQQQQQGIHNVPELAPIPVVVWPLWEFGPKTAEALHIELNGLDESPFLVRIDDPLHLDPKIVWIGDTGYAYGWAVWCNKFLQQIRRAQTLRHQRNLPTSWPIIIVDWTDSPTQQVCPHIEDAIGKSWVKYTKRSIAGWRHYNATSGWVHTGRRVDLNKTGRDYVPTPLPVRTDTIQHLHDALQLRNFTLADAIEERLERPMDVTHMWPLDPTAHRSGVGNAMSELRTRVSRLVHDFGNRTGWTVHVGLAGTAVHAGRRGVSSAYIEALLSTKIVVVTQRDIWEDHYRLFEALVSGALVVTDTMLSLPVGLQNGTSIVEAGSADQLDALLEYYLQHPVERMAVAREGRRIAMSRHRSWHRLEEILFGRPLSVCNLTLEERTPSRGSGSSSCPYIVHANETRL